MATEKGQPCGAEVANHPGGCRRPAEWERGGVWYCWQHDPEWVTSGRGAKRKRFEAGDEFLSENDLRLIADLGGVRAVLRALEACRRYFEHCRRVSLSARHAGVDSPEMAVRMALMREAYEALGLNDRAGSG